MSSEAIEVVRRGYEAYQSDGIEGIIPILDPAVEWRNPPDSPIAGVFHGHEGVREWQRLADESFDALVQYLPEGKVCGGDPIPGAPVLPPADGNGEVTEEKGLSDVPAGAPERGLTQAGAPPAEDGHGPAVSAGMRIDEDGGVEFTIAPPADHGQTVVITSQTLPAAAGATVDGAALSVEYVDGTARRCEVVDAPA